MFCSSFQIIFKRNQRNYKNFSNIIQNINLINIRTTSTSTTSTITTTTTNDNNNNNQLSLQSISRQIVYEYHPLTINNFERTLNTIFKNKKLYSYLISTISFKAGNELRLLIDWLNQVIQNNGSLIPIEKTLDQTKEPYKRRLKFVIGNYWKMKYINEIELLANDKNSNQELIKKYNDKIQSKIENQELPKIINTLVDSVPVNVAEKITLELQKITNVPSFKKKGTHKIVPENEVEAFFSKIITSFSSNLPTIYPLLVELDIPPIPQKRAENILDELEKQNKKTIQSLENLLKRAIKTLPKVVETGGIEKKKNTTHPDHFIHISMTPIREISNYDLFDTPKENFEPLFRKTSSTFLRNDIKDDFFDEITPLEDTEVRIGKELSFREFDDLADPETAEFKTIAQFIHDSRTDIYRNISEEFLEASDSTYKILIDNLPPRITDQEFKQIFERMHGVKFYQIYNSRAFEASGNQVFPADSFDPNQKIKKWSQVKKVIRSDSYAFVTLSPEGYAIATRDDLKLFGCSVKGYRCRMREAKAIRTLIIEVTNSLPIGQFVELFSICFAGEYEITYNQMMKYTRVNFVHVEFETHEEAWKASAQLEVMMAEMSTPFFSFEWIKTTWYHQSSLKARERRRNLFAKSQCQNETEETQSKESDDLIMNL